MTTVTFHLNSKQSSIARDGRWISLHLCTPVSAFPIVLQTLIRTPRPASFLLLTPLLAVHCFWAEPPRPSERTYGSRSADYNGGSSAPSLCDWNVLERSFEFSERHVECLCARVFNTLPPERQFPRLGSCFRDMRQRREAVYILTVNRFSDFATYGSFDLGMRVPNSFIL